MDVSVIIINYNTRALTLACLGSIFRYTAGLKWEVIVVDNASTECDPALFTDAFASIRLIRSHRNLGFAGGNNLGLREARGKYVLLLNSDVKLKSNAIFRCWRFMEEHSRIGVTTIRLVFPDGMPQAVAQRFPSLRYKLAEWLRIQKVLGPQRGGRLLLGSFFDYRMSTEVDWVWGAYFMFRRVMLDALPGRKLNDDYFMYGEDMQWCFDFRKRGWKIWFSGDSEAIHLMGGSAGSKEALIIDGQRRFMKTNYSFAHRLCVGLVEHLLHGSKRLLSTLSV